MNKKDVNLIQGVLVFLQSENSDGLDSVLMGSDRVMNLIAFKALWEREKVLVDVKKILEIWIDTPNSNIQDDLDVIEELLEESEFKDAFTIELLNILIWSRVERGFRDKFSWTDLDTILSEESEEREKRLTQEYEHCSPILKEIMESRKERPLEKSQISTISSLIPELYYETELNWVFDAISDSLIKFIEMNPNTCVMSLNESLEAVSYFNLLNGLWKGLKPKLDSVHQISLIEDLALSRENLEEFLEKAKIKDPGFEIVLKGLDEVEEVKEEKKEDPQPKKATKEDAESVFLKYKKLLDDTPDVKLSESEIVNLCKSLNKVSRDAVVIKVGPGENLAEKITEEACLRAIDMYKEIFEVFSKVDSMTDDNYPRSANIAVEKTREALEADYERLHSLSRLYSNHHPESKILEKFTLEDSKPKETGKKSYSISDYIKLFDKDPNLKMTDIEIGDLCNVLKESAESRIKIKVKPDGDMRDIITGKFCLGLSENLGETFGLYSKLVSMIRKHRDDYSKNLQDRVLKTERVLNESYVRAQSYIKLCRNFTPEDKDLEKVYLSCPRYFTEGERISKDIKKKDLSPKDASDYLENVSLIKDNEEDMKNLLEKMTMALKKIPVIETKSNPWDSLTYEICKEKVDFFTTIVKLGCELSKYLIKLKDSEKLLKEFDQEMIKCHKSLKLTIKVRAQYGNNKEFTELGKML